VEETVTIERSPSDVWAVVVDPMQDPAWCRKVKEVEPAGPRRWKVSRRPMPVRPPTELLVEHLDVEIGSRLTMREQDDASTFSIEYRLEPASSGTHFTQVSECRWHRLPRPLQRLLAYGVRRDVRAQLRDLKRLLEEARPGARASWIARSMTGALGTLGWCKCGVLPPAPLRTHSARCSEREGSAGAQRARRSRRRARSSSSSSTP